MSTPLTRLRPAVLTDLPALLELIPLSVRALSEGYYSPAQTESALRYIFGPDTRLIEDGTYFVVETVPDDGTAARLVGCGGWSRRRTLYGGDQMKSAVAEPDDLLDPATESARVRAFFVHPDHARQDTATRLLQACRAAASRAGFTRLELAATLPGEPFYSRHGFVADAMIQEVLPDGMPIAFVRMSAKVDPPPAA